METEYIRQARLEQQLREAEYIIANIAENAIEFGIRILLIYITYRLITAVIKYFIRYGVDYYIEKTKDKEKPRP